MEQIIRNLLDAAANDHQRFATRSMVQLRPQRRSDKLADIVGRFEYSYGEMLQGVLKLKEGHGGVHDLRAADAGTIISDDAGTIISDNGPYWQLVSTRTILAQLMMIPTKPAGALTEFIIWGAYPPPLRRGRDASQKDIVSLSDVVASSSTLSSTLLFGPGRSAPTEHMSDARVAKTHQ